MEARQHHGPQETTSSTLTLQEVPPSHLRAQGRFPAKQQHHFSSLHCEPAQSSLPFTKVPHPCL